MRKAIVIGLLLVGCSMGCSKSKVSKQATLAVAPDQTVNVTSNSSTAQVTIMATIKGLPQGCVATASDTIITIASCGSTPVPPVQITQDATAPLPTSSGSVNVSPTADPPIPGVSGNKLTMASAGQTFDFTVPVTIAGSFTLSARLCNDASTTGGSLTVHFEYPAGTPISSSMTLAGGQQWTTVASIQAFAIPTGNATVRMVVDSLATGGSKAAYIHWFQLNPSGAAAHAVTLNWAAPASTPPTNPECLSAKCPLPSGATPCIAPATAYSVYRSQTSNSYGAPLATVPSPPYKDSTVVSGQTYYYTVKASNPSACSPTSVASNEVKAVIPSP